MLEGLTHQRCPGYCWHKKTVIVDQRTHCCRVLSRIIRLNVFQNLPKTKKNNINRLDEAVHFDQVLVLSQMMSPCDFFAVHSPDAHYLLEKKLKGRYE